MGPKDQHRAENGGKESKHHSSVTSGKVP